MHRKLIAALIASTLSAPAIAIEPSSLAPNSTMFYFSIPLDGKTEKERAPSFGMAMRGSRDYQVLNIDSRFVNNMIMRLEGEGFVGIEATWLVVGGVAAAAAVAVGSSGKSSVTQQQQQQQVNQAAGVTGSTTGTGTTSASVPCAC